MALCSLCGKHAYDPDADRVCYACRIDDDDDYLIMGAKYLMEGHSYECIEGLLKCKICICEVRNGNATKAVNPDKSNRGFQK